MRFQWSDEYLLLDATYFFCSCWRWGLRCFRGLRSREHRCGRRLDFRGDQLRAVEWATGAAVGWAIILLAILPMALGRALHIRFWVDNRSLWLAGLNLVTIAVLALAMEVAFRGYTYLKLIGAIGPVWATIVMSVVYGIVATVSQEATLLSTAIATLLGVVLCTAWLRTHALWLGWGLHFAWIASLGVVFGLPVAGIDNLSSLVESRAIGVRWLTGGDLGPEGALVTPLLLMIAIAVVALVSRDWAWDYTRKPLVPAGYPMDVPPPAAHDAMEKQAASPALVQILPTTPQAMSQTPANRTVVGQTGIAVAPLGPEGSEHSSS